MNKYYCEAGHANIAVDGKKPSFCGSCGKKMGGGFTPINKPVISNGHIPSPQNQLESHQSQRPLSFAERLRQRSSKQEDYSYEEDGYFPDIDGLSVELEIHDVTQGYTVDRVAVGQQVSDGIKGKKMSKTAKKNAFQNLMNESKTKTSIKEF